MNRGLFGISNESNDTLLGTAVGRPAVEVGSVFIGYQAGRLSTGLGTVGDTFVGYQAGQNNSPAQGATMGNTFIGYQAGQSNVAATNNTFVGYLAGSTCTSGGNNTALGRSAGKSSTTAANGTFVGASAGQNSSSADNLTCIGYLAGGSDSTGASNVFVGYQSGYTANSANATTTGTRQTNLGYNTGQNSATQRNDTVAVGYQALVDGNNAIAIGSGVLAGAAGTVTIGMDSAGTSASSTVQDEIKLGTATHTTNVIGKSKVTAHAKTSGALSTATLSSGTGAQIDTTTDRETVTPVTFNPGAATTATALVEISPDNVTYSTLGTETEPVGVALDGTIHLLRLQVPAAWYLRITVTNATLGTTTYY